MRLRSSKVNEFRLWGLAMTMGGMLLMIVGLAGVVFDWGKAGRIIAVVFMIIGMISMMVSMGIYFWAGMLSTSATAIDCPECGRRTKMLGKTDRCMFCKTILTMDPQYESTEESESPVGQAPLRDANRDLEHKPH
ncbi:YgzB family protein [Paenibacillus sp. SYP-B3998]|uniref:YgzB family protein n=1 Tax=Paenibacillus sp. SYP-B3998 TaxID=2678564 RepID=A0A6G4A5Q7_9BACL|nr:YgzB family protein [Paenibacillus sp. SYP-B3998]